MRKEGDIVYWLDDDDHFCCGVVASSEPYEDNDATWWQVRSFDDEYGLPYDMRDDWLVSSTDELMPIAMLRLKKAKDAVDRKVADCTASLLDKIHRSKVDKCHRIIKDRSMGDVYDKLEQLRQMCSERITRLDDARAYMDKYPEDKMPYFDDKVDLWLSVYRLCYLWVSDLTDAIRGKQTEDYEEHNP